MIQYDNDRTAREGRARERKAAMVLPR
jgi:hypothetical protein